MTTSLRNYDDLDLIGAVVASDITEIREEVRLVPAPRLDASRQSWEGASDSDWTWVELRDYVLRQITLVSGGVTDNPAKVAGIMKRFVKEYGVHSATIARYAFEVCGGWWNNQPITVARFCKANDPYFAQVILDRLGLGR